jgi:Uma2 family endonuclease
METIATPKLPLTLAERAQGPDLLRVEASWAEYVELLDLVDYPIFYLNQTIISIMGQASIPHEMLVSNINRVLANYYFVLPDFAVMGSNVLIYAESAQEAYNADLSVVRGQPDSRDLPDSYSPKTTLRNPYLVVEVMSPSTKKFDRGEKLESYVRIPSLQHILFVDQDTVSVRAYSRSDKAGQWLDNRFDSLDDLVTLGDMTLTVSDIYHKTMLGKVVI